MKLLKTHLEWMVFGGGLLLLGLMDPATTGTSFCLFELLGFDFCPGEGLGHSIAYTFRGDISSALDAHLFGPAAVVILISRVLHIWYKQFKKSNELNTEDLLWQQ